MAEYTDRDGNRFELPKLTLSLDDAFDDAVDASKPKRERVAAQMKLLRECLGADYVAKRCGGKTADSVDVAELAVLMVEVRAAYRERESGAAMGQAMRQLEEMQPVLDDLRSVMAMMERKPSRQGFNRVF